MRLILVLEIDCHIIFSSVFLKFILIIHEFRFSLPFSIRKLEHFHRLIMLYSLRNVQNDKSIHYGLRCVGFNPKVKPLVVTMSICIALQEKVVNVLLLVPENRMKICSFEIANKSKLV